MSWVDWRADDAWLDVYEVTKTALRLRREHPALRQRHWFEGRPTIDGGRKDLTWLHPSGREMTGDDWADDALSVVGMLAHRRSAPLPGAARRAAVGLVVPDLAQRGGRSGGGHHAARRVERQRRGGRVDLPRPPAGSRVEEGGALLLDARTVVVIREDDRG